MTFGEFQIFVALSILFLRLALSIRTTAKGTGAFLGIQESSVLIVLLPTSPLIEIVTPGIGDFLQITLLSIHLLTFS